MERKTGRSKAEKKNGQKWVEGNYDAKMKAKAENGGVLPETPALQTSDHSVSREWSSENLPEILFYLTPPQSRYQGETVQYLYNEDTGETICSEEGHPIKDFEILPRYISVEVEGWMIEAWRRIDTRITYQDILDRQRSDPTFGGIGLKKLSKNALQNHCYRDCRKILNSWVEYGRRDEPHRTEVETIEELSYSQIVYNTVLRECSEFKGRLVRFAFKRQTEDGLFRLVSVPVTPANVRQTTFDIVHFMDATLPIISPDNYMTPSMDAAWEMSLVLMERARMHSKSHWSKLDRQCLPMTWFDRLKASQKTVSNGTYDGGCAVCSWTEGRNESFTWDQEKEDYLATPRKRIRGSSDSHSDEPLSQKRKRARLIKHDLDSDSESEVEVVIDGGSPQTRYGSSPASSLAFTTPSHSRSGSGGKEAYDIEMDVYDNDTTQNVPPSERQSMWYSGGLLDVHYRSLHTPMSISDSPLAKFSSRPYHGLGTGYHPAHIRPTAARVPQPQWEELGFATTALSQPYDFTYPDSGEVHGLGLYQGWTDRGDLSFTSAHADQSSSSGDPGLATAGTSFTSEFEISDLQAAQAKMQRLFTYDPDAEWSGQERRRHPGRMTAQGSKLSTIFSPPPLKLTGDLEMSPLSYQPGNPTVDSSFLRRHSFDGHLPVDFSFTPYGNMIEPDLQCGEGDLDYANSPFALPDVVNGDNRSELLPAAILSTPQGRNNMSFLHLLSSDPVMPEHYHNPTYSTMSYGKARENAFLGHQTVNHDSPMDQSTPRLGRQKTPPLLEY